VRIFLDGRKKFNNQNSAKYNLKKSASFFLYVVLIIVTIHKVLPLKNIDLLVFNEKALAYRFLCSNK